MSFTQLSKSMVYFWSAVKVKLFEISSQAGKSNNCGPLISSPSSPSASPHWWCWSWRALLQFGQWCMLLQVPEAFFSLILGTIGGWLIGQTQGTDPHTHRPTLTHSLSGSEQGLSCCSTLVWGFSSVGRVTEGWWSKTLAASKVLTPLEEGQEEVEFLFFKNSIRRFLSLFMVEGFFLLLTGRGSGILSPFSREMEKVPNETLIE